jgi:hypothetical protein
MALVTESELEQRLSRSLTTDESSAFTLINSAMQAYVENMIGSSLETETASTRYYDGGFQNLKIDPCTSITAVKLVDENQDDIETIDSEYYIQEPLNKTLKTMIRYRFGKLYGGMRNIAVTAQFSIAGDTNTVGVIKDAMLDALMSEIDNSETILKESIEGYSVEMAQPETKSSLANIKFLFPEII